MLFFSKKYNAECISFNVHTFFGLGLQTYPDDNNYYSVLRTEVAIKVSNAVEIRE